VLASPARARRQPTALVASLGPREAHTTACLLAFRLHAAVHRAAAVTAAGPRRRPTPHLPSGSVPPLGELMVPHGRLPGRDRRRLAGLAGPAPPLGQGPNCCDLNLVRVFRVKLQGWFVKNPI
jgi:hypothetical protein